MTAPTTPKELVEALGQLSEEMCNTAAAYPDDVFNSEEFEADYANRAAALIAEAFERWSTKAWHEGWRLGAEEATEKCDKKTRRLAKWRDLCLDRIADLDRQMGNMAAESLDHQEALQLEAERFAAQATKAKAETDQWRHACSWWEQQWKDATAQRDKAEETIKGLNTIHVITRTRAEKAEAREQYYARSDRIYKKIMDAVREKGVVRYESIAKRRPGSELADYEIRPEGAGKGTPKVATVWGHYGQDAEATARIIVDVLNAQEEQP